MVQSVGYPNPNRSHFESMAIWHTAEPKPTFETTGWLARGLDTRPATDGGDVPALHVADAVLPRLSTAVKTTYPHLRTCSSSGDGWVSRPRSLMHNAPPLTRSSAAGAVNPARCSTSCGRTRPAPSTLRARLERVLADGDGSPLLLGRRLGLIAQLIKAQLTTSIYYTHSAVSTLTGLRASRTPTCSSNSTWRSALL